MPDTLTTVTNLIQSPPGQLAAGGVLAGIVWKFFERAGALVAVPYWAAVIVSRVVG